MNEFRQFFREVMRKVGRKIAIEQPHLTNDQIDQAIVSSPTIEDYFYTKRFPAMNQSEREEYGERCYREMYKETKDFLMKNKLWQ